MTAGPKVSPSKTSLEIGTLTGWEEKLQQYDVRMAVLRYSTPGERRFLSGRQGIRRLMLASPNWQLVYWDDLGMVFVRADSVDKDCQRCANLVHFDPDNNIPLTDDANTVHQELVQVLKLSGPSPRVYTALSRTAMWAGNRPQAAKYLTEGLRLYPEHPILTLLSQRLVEAVGTN